MSRLHRKFMIVLTAVLIVVIGIFLFLNNRFVERYYTYQTKQTALQICMNLKENPDRTDSIIAEALAKHGAVVVLTENTTDNIELNIALHQAFLDQGLAMERYWLWEGDYNETIAHGFMQRIYQQPNLKYSLLVTYVDLGDTLGNVAMILPDIEGMLSIINVITLLGAAVVILIIVVILYFLIGRILIPVNKMAAATETLGSRDFHPIDVSTRDELADLAGSMNQMNDRLLAAREQLLAKNRSMEELLANVSHDLKTPVALIQAYASGMQDGLDDGTFLDTILAQTQRMEQLLAQILKLSYLKQTRPQAEHIDMAGLLTTKLSQYQNAGIDDQIRFSCDVETPLPAYLDPDLAATVFDNLISNAVKYTGDGDIRISLKRTENGILFTTANRLPENTELEPARLWESFYVGDQSRSRAWSGHGLGLSIVKTAVEAQGGFCTCSIEDGQIIFRITFTDEM